MIVHNQMLSSKLEIIHSHIKHTLTQTITELNSSLFCFIILLNDSPYCESSLLVSYSIMSSPSICIDLIERLLSILFLF